MARKQLKDSAGVDFYPYTDLDAVIDSNENTLSTLLGYKQDEPLIVNLVSLYQEQTSSDGYEFTVDKTATELSTAISDKRPIIIHIPSAIGISFGMGELWVSSESYKTGDCATFMFFAGDTHVDGALYPSYGMQNNQPAFYVEMFRTYQRKLEGGFNISNVNKQSLLDNQPAMNLTTGAYCSCATAANTAAKTVTLGNYALTEGTIACVKFTNAVGANATLNINNTGAKSLYYNGAAITAGLITAGDVATFIYDGTRYQLLTINRFPKKVTVSIKTIAGAQATVGSMTYAQISAANAAGLPVIATYSENNIIYHLTSCDSSNAIFETVHGNTLYKITCSNVNSWNVTSTSLNDLPSVSSSDNGKVLQVVNGAWAAVTPTTVYSGSGVPDNSQGNNGDLYAQI